MYGSQFMPQDHGLFELRASLCLSVVLQSEKVNIDVEITAHQCSGACIVFQLFQFALHIA